MADTPVEPEVTTESNKDIVESSLVHLWEKARRISDLVIRLKKENRTLRAKIGEYEGHQGALTKDLEHIKAELEQTRAKLLQEQSNGSGFFTKEEKEAFVLRIKELIAKLNSRL